MYTLLKNISSRQVYARELPAFGVSLLLAEMFYKFGSFILECGAFLATWWLVSYFLDKIGVPRIDKK
jgi:hypothetical protein